MRLRCLEFEGECPNTRNTLITFCIISQYLNFLATLHQPAVKVMKSTRTAEDGLCLCSSCNSTYDVTVEKTLENMWRGKEKTSLSCFKTAKCFLSLIQLGTGRRGDVSGSQFSSAKMNRCSLTLKQTHKCTDTNCKQMKGDDQFRNEMNSPALLCLGGGARFMSRG